MDSETQAPLKASDPRMVAWGQYIASEEYANAKRWAVLPEHTEGSMWHAFVSGWETRPAAPHAAPREGEPELDEATRLRRALHGHIAYTHRICDEAEATIADLRAQVASQQAALDAAGEALDRLAEWRDDYALFHGPNCPITAWVYVGERLCTCGSARLRKMLDAIAAARASHPEARDGQ